MPTPITPEAHRAQKKPPMYQPTPPAATDDDRSAAGGPGPQTGLPRHAAGADRHAPEGPSGPSASPGQVRYAPTSPEEEVYSAWPTGRVAPLVR